MGQKVPQKDGKSSHVKSNVFLNTWQFLLTVTALLLSDGGSCEYSVYNFSIQLLLNLTNELLWCLHEHLKSCKVCEEPPYITNCTPCYY